MSECKSKTILSLNLNKSILKLTKSIFLIILFVTISNSQFAYAKSGLIESDSRLGSSGRWSYNISILKNKFILFIQCSGWTGEAFEFDLPIETEYFSINYGRQLNPGMGEYHAKLTATGLSIDRGGRCEAAEIEFQNTYDNNFNKKIEKTKNLIDQDESKLYVNGKILPDKILCNLALDYKQLNYSKIDDIQVYVTEAKRRGFSDKDCRNIVRDIDTNKTFSDDIIEFCKSYYDKKSSNFTQYAKTFKAETILQENLTVEKCQLALNQNDLIEIRNVKFDKYSYLIELVKIFTKNEKPSTDPVKFAIAVDRLRKAVDGTTEAAKKDAYQKLISILSTDANFQAFKKKKEDEDKRADNEILRKLNSDAKVIKAFIADYLNKNPIAEHAADLGDIITSLDSDIKSQNLTSFKATVESVRNKIDEYKLSATFENYKLKYSISVNDIANSTEAPAVSQILKLTSNNKILLEGSKDDIVILYNATKDAPNVATNLAGRLSFEKDQAYICWYQTKPSDNEHKRQALQELNKLGALKVSDPKLNCEPSTFSKYDIIILERGLFLSSPIDYALPLNEKVEKSEFTLASLLKGDDILSEIQKHETLAQLVENEVEKDLRTGFGIVRIGNDNKVICATISDHQDGHRKLLSGKTSEISDQLGGRGSILELSMEQAFISAKKNQCGIIYSSAADMKSLYSALKRESIPYKTLPIWFSLKEIEEADKAFKNEQTAALQSEEQARQKIADEAQLKEASENTAEALRKKKENQLRSTYAVTAKALSDEVGKKILDDVSKLTANSQENQKPNYLSMFRELSSWYQKKINEQWELADSRFEIYDYGTSRWNDRRIDTIFNKISIKIKNRTIGKYDERCVITGLVVDKEFEMYREPFESSCDNVESSLENWMKARSFEERWIVRK